MQACCPIRAVARLAATAGDGTVVCLIGMPQRNGTEGKQHHQTPAQPQNPQLCVLKPRLHSAEAASSQPSATSLPCPHSLAPFLLQQIEK